MSTSLLRKSLNLCDPDLEENPKKRKKNTKDFKGRVTYINKHQKIESTRKLTVKEARDKIKQKEQTLKDNLFRLKLSKKHKIKLDKDTVDLIIERAVTRKPIKSKQLQQKDEKTAFTEEDFKKFEEEFEDN